MRIVGGTYRGRKIEVSKGFDSRPTTDFAKEAVFNILHNYFDFGQIKVLDLFSGTGSISLEFASRGCTVMDMVDINGKCIAFISKLSEEMGIKGMHPVRMDVFRFIGICKRQYDIIFADPPYDLKNLKEIPDAVFGKKILESQGWLILEHGKDYSFRDHPFFFEERHYGSIHFSFFKQN